MENTTALTWWVGILTLLVAVQTFAVALLAMRSRELFRRAQTTLDSVDRALGPMTDSAKELLSDLHAIKRTAQRAEEAVVRRIWPVISLAAAARAAIRRVSTRSRRPRDSRQDEDARSRFISEGGPIHGVR